MTWRVTFRPRRSKQQTRRSSHIYFVVIDHIFVSISTWIHSHHHGWSFFISIQRGGDVTTSIRRKHGVPSTSCGTSVLQVLSFVPLLMKSYELFLLSLVVDVPCPMHIPVVAIKVACYSNHNHATNRPCNMLRYVLTITPPSSETTFDLVNTFCH